MQNTNIQNVLAQHQHQNAMNKKCYTIGNDNEIRNIKLAFKLLNWTTFVRLYFNIKVKLCDIRATLRRVVTVVG